MKSQDEYLAQVFKEPPLTAFKKQKNLRDLLIRAKVPGPIKSKPERKLKGMFRCNTDKCTACPFINENNKVKVNETFTWKHNKKFTCNTNNIIYMIECKKDNCKQRYVGQTGRSLRSRLAEHRGYVVNNHDTATGAHFNTPGHTLSDLTITTLEQVKNNNRSYREQREEYFIQKFNTAYKGLNRKI